LRHLEYRGYDSAGIAISHGDSEFIVKCTGNVDCLEQKICSILEQQQQYSTLHSDNIIGIAHTRWATHGNPSDMNAHPHTSDVSNMLVVVHNGIITNFKALRDLLISKGYQIVTQTDTEVIPKLCQYIYENDMRSSQDVKFPDLKDIVLVMLERYLEGAFALLIKSRLFPSQMVMCRKGSPLIMGIIEDHINKTHPDTNTNTFVFSSDVLALINQTNQVISLQDDELIHLKEGKAHFYKNYLIKIPQLLKIEQKYISKGAYRTFMEKEIFEQLQTLAHTLAGGTGDEQMYLSHVRHCSKIICIACGTSLNSCLASRNILMKYTGKLVCIECSSDFLDREIPITSSDFCIFVSQSGETADTLQALLYVKKHGIIGLHIFVWLSF
jgi:glucosamine--fructose-6-phosphate aminotransferase (isomerizing)